MKWDPTVLEENVEKSLFRYEIRVIKKSMKPDQVQEFEEIDGILYYQGRITQENQLKTQDLDGCKLLDFIEIGQPVTLVLEDSPVLYLYIMWIHNKINPHAGVKATVRDVCKKMRVPKGLRKLVKKITQDCVKCKIKMKKVSKVKMSIHNEARTVLAPPFHASMADIVYSFKENCIKEHGRN